MLQIGDAHSILMRMKVSYAFSLTLGEANVSERQMKPSDLETLAESNVMCLNQLNLSVFSTPRYL